MSEKPNLALVIPLGITVFLAFVVAVVAHDCASSYARDGSPPPLIQPMPRVRTPAPDTRQPADPPAWAQPADGPMCLPEAEIEPPPATEFGLLVSGDISDQERAEVELWVSACKRFERTKNPWVKSRSLQDPPDPWKLLALVRLERDLGVPVAGRGILGAAWCWESAFRSAPRAGDIGASHGPFQMQGWFWAKCGYNGWTFDIVAAARCYWSVADAYLNDGKCPGDWARAEAMAANGERYGALSRGQASFFKDPARKQRAYCNVRSRHYEELMRWRPT